MTKPPLHERLRGLIPKAVEKRIPEKLKPPAWREPPQSAPSPHGAFGPNPPEWALGDRRELKFVWGAKAMVWSGDSALNYGTVVEFNSKGYQLPAPLTLPYGTEGTMLAVGPDFVVLDVGGRGYRVNKSDLIASDPETERRLGVRIRVLEVRRSDVVVEA